MRFAITGCDRYVRVFEEFLAAGWSPVKLFSSHAQNRLSANERMIELARRHGCPVQLTRMVEADLQDLQQRGCEVIVAASYDWRIPRWEDYLQYAVNFHPSPLPLGRGPYPLPRAILEQHKRWAISCHRIEQEFDTGPILLEEAFDLHETESHETLNLKLQMAAGRLAKNLAPQFTTLWDQAAVQGRGEYWPPFSQDERTLDFTAGVEDVLRKSRAFGVLECYARLNGQQIYVRHALGWPEHHNLAPETVVHVNGQEVVLAVRDGYVALMDWGVIPPVSPPIPSPPPQPLPAN